MGSLLMERIFRSTPNRVQMAHTEWLPGVRLRHFSLSGRALAAQARCPGFNFLWLPAFSLSSIFTSYIKFSLISQTSLVYTSNVITLNHSTREALVLTVCPCVPLSILQLNNQSCWVDARIGCLGNAEDLATGHAKWPLHRKSFETKNVYNLADA